MIPNAVEWTPYRREVLRSALRKAQAGADQREAIHMRGDESGAMFYAAKAWAELLDFLDERAEAGDLAGLAG